MSSCPRCSPSTLPISPTISNHSLSALPPTHSQTTLHLRLLSSRTSFLSLPLLSSDSQVKKKSKDDNTLKERVFLWTLHSGAGSNTCFCGSLKHNPCGIRSKKTRHSKDEFPNGRRTIVTCPNIYFPGHDHSHSLFLQKQT